MGKPELSKIIEMMERGGDFELSNQQYKNKTGADFPKNKSYAERNSAVAKRAAAYGYYVKVIPQRIVFKKK